MAKGWDYKSGDWNLVCDVCSKKVKASTTKERWDGFRVCTSCFETRQPLDFIRSRQDKISVEFTRSQQTNIYTTDYVPSDSTWNGESLNLLEMN